MKTSDLDEIEQIGRDLEARTPASTSTQDLDKKLAFLTELRVNSPDIAPAKYFDAYERHLREGLTRGQLAKEMKLSRGTIYKYFDKIEAALSAQAGKTGNAVEIVYLLPSEIDNTLYQPRAMITSGRELMLDIAEREGNIYPVLLQKRSGHSKPATIDGHRRVDAISKINETRDQADWIYVKCELREIEDKEAALLAYQANVLSSPLSEGERDKWIFRLLGEFGYSVKEVCELTGLAEATVSNIRRAFTKTTEAVRERLAEGTISTGIAKAIASLPPAQQTRLAKKAEQKRLSVRAVEEEAARLKCRETARAKILDFLKRQYSSPEGRVIVLTRRHPLQDPRGDFYDQILRDVFGTSWPHEGTYTVMNADVRWACRRLGFKFQIEEERVLCQSCFWNSHGKCAFDIEGYPKVFECEMQVPKPDQFTYRGSTCSICGQISIGVEDYTDFYGTHNVCIITEAEQKGLRGLCLHCGNACDLVDTVNSPSDEISRIIEVHECSRFTPRKSLDELVAISKREAAKMIAKEQQSKQILRKNMELEKQRQAEVETASGRDA